MIESTVLAMAPPLFEKMLPALQETIKEARKIVILAGRSACCVLTKISKGENITGVGISDILLCWHSCLFGPERRSNQSRIAPN